MTSTANQQKAIELREIGNDLFKNKQFNAAIGVYTESIKLHRTPEGFRNRAQAKIMMKRLNLLNLSNKFFLNYIKINYKLKFYN